MTEAEWLACTDPQPMLEFLQDRASDRKLRLFAVASCLPLSDLFRSPRKRQVPKVAEVFFAVLTIAEQFSDGNVKEKERKAAYYRTIRGKRLVQSEWMIDALDAVRCAVAIPTSNSAKNAARFANHACKRQRPFQSHLLHCIFGPLPFRPVPLDPSWLTSTVKRLAEAIYKEKAFALLPILADALEDAGCTNTDILNHCRQPGEHVRGCWVVDLILGKE